MTTLAQIKAAAQALPPRQRRRLIEDLTVGLAKKGRKNQMTLHQKIKRHCGIVATGVADLATNKKHLEGFGAWKQ